MSESGYMGPLTAGFRGRPSGVLRVAYDAPGMVKADLVTRAMEAKNLESWAVHDALDALRNSVGSTLERGDLVCGAAVRRVPRLPPQDGNGPESAPG